MWQLVIGAKILSFQNIFIVTCQYFALHITAKSSITFILLTRLEALLQPSENLALPSHSYYSSLQGEVPWNGTRSKTCEFYQQIQKMCVVNTKLPSRSFIQQKPRNKIMAVMQCITVVKTIITNNSNFSRCFRTIQNLLNPVQLYMKHGLIYSLGTFTLQSSYGNFQACRRVVP